jgi:hypothetical protein
MRLLRNRGNKNTIVLHHPSIQSEIIGTNAEQNTLIFKVSTSFLARILKPTHHMVNLSNESDQA